MSRVLIVSNRLPVRIEKNEEGELEYKPSEGGLATGLGSIYKDGDNLWIGWPGIALASEDQQQTVTDNLKEHKMAPVFLTQHEVHNFYLGFSNQILWPAFHYFTQYINYDDKFWEAYKSVNQKFTDAITPHIKDENTTVWIHDYQLLLVPGMLRKKFPKVSIGFFQHIPFPSYEIFRLLPWREELLEGMLGADYLAFHTYDDMRHFISSSHRILGLHYKRNEIELRTRLVTVDSLPMGIDYEKYEKSASTKEAIRREKSYHKSLGVRSKVVLSMDRLDYSKGIKVRLKTFDKFLERYPRYRQKITLLLIVVPSRDKVPSYQHLKDEIDELVGKINSKYGRMSWQPIHYFYRSYPLVALSAFYRMSDVAMITPLRDGMNLVCKEYVASRIDQKGVLILSEMAGSAKELSDAILVNPTNQNQMVEALRQALEMPEEEQRKAMVTMQKSLRKYTIFKWVDLFLNNLNKVKAKQVALATNELNEAHIKQIYEDYESSLKRLLLLDYDGTLVPFSKNPEDCAPDEELIKIISDLASDPKNYVVVISGRAPEHLTEWLGELPIELVAEHGAWERIDGEWRLHPTLTNQEWKDEAREIMEFYVDRTPGSFIETKRNSLAWHYRKVEPGLGKMRSIDLEHTLNSLMDSQSLGVMQGNNVVEIKPFAINKGKVSGEIFNRINPDFTLALGDDRTDEDTFEVLPRSAYTIKVGNVQTYARYFIESHSEARNFLKNLASDEVIKTLDA